MISIVTYIKKKIWLLLRKESDKEKTRRQEMEWFEQTISSNTFPSLHGDCQNLRQLNGIYEDYELIEG